MREIIFRGKRIDNGEWVQSQTKITLAGEYGDDCYIPNSNDSCLSSSYDLQNNLKGLELNAAYRVHPDTVGQYTGLTDKNGTRIFEGDILAVGDNEKEDLQRVFVHFKDGQFIVSYYALNLLCDRNMSSKVIGNIHDNPELLPEGDPQNDD